MSTNSRDGLLELVLGQPRPQPLHIAVTQQAACVKDTANGEAKFEIRLNKEEQNVHDLPNKSEQCALLSYQRKPFHRPLQQEGLNSIKNNE